MVGAISIHVKIDLLDNIRDVRACESEILQGSYKTLIQDGIVIYEVSTKVLSFYLVSTRVVEYLHDVMPTLEIMSLA